MLLFSRQMAVKHEMKARLRSNPGEFEQTIFEFELVNGEPVAASFEWEEKGSEFSYHGSMYDVIEKKITGNILQLRCIDDKKEADIIRKMERLGQQERKGNKAGIASLQEFLSLLLFNQHNCADPVNSKLSPDHFDQYRNTFIAFVSDIISPPPKRIVVTYC